MKKIKWQFIVLILIISSHVAFSQQAMEDVVYLKNGSIIHGMVLEQVPGQSLKIQTADRNIFVFRMDEVEKIVKEPVGDKIKNGSKPHFQVKEKGYENIVEAGFIFGVGDAKVTSSWGGGSVATPNKSSAVSLHDLNGVKVSSSVFTGVGVGYHVYLRDEAYLPEAGYIPLFAALRFSPMSQTNNMFLLGLDAGAEFGVTKYSGMILGFGPLTETYDFKGGWFINPSIGIKILSSNKNFVSVSIGYKYFENKIDYSLQGVYNYYYGGSYHPVTISESDSFTFRSHFLNFTFGFGF